MSADELVCFLCGSCAIVRDPAPVNLPKGDLAFISHNWAIRSDGAITNIPANTISCSEPGVIIGHSACICILAALRCELAASGQTFDWKAFAAWINNDRDFYCNKNARDESYFADLLLEEFEQKIPDINSEVNSPVLLPQLTLSPQLYADRTIFHRTSSDKEYMDYIALQRAMLNAIVGDLQQPAPSN
ncbi:hypothetical protein HDU82_006628, partial [Entophlyctis luteolus]